MTEEAWLMCDSPCEMLHGMPIEPSRRKILLLCTTSARQIEKVIPSEGRKACVDWMERHAEGLASRDLEYDRLRWLTYPETHEFDELKRPFPQHIVTSLHELPDEFQYYSDWYRVSDKEQEFLSDAARHLYWMMSIDGLRDIELDSYTPPALISLGALYDIFGNPFHPVAITTQMQSQNVLEIAQSLYDMKDFSKMPILADALEDAGCNDATILAHCRDPHITHVRGCWVVDLILGKE